MAQNPETEQSWLEKLTKEGALSQSGDFISMMMEILTALLAMAQQQEMSHAKMELITKLATEKKADFTEHCPGYDKVEIAIAENGKATLHTIKDGVEKNTVLSSRHTKPGPLRQRQLRRCHQVTGHQRHCHRHHHQAQRERDLRRARPAAASRREPTQHR